MDSAVKASRILLVDDNEVNIMLLEGMLDEAGFSNHQSTIDPDRVLPMLDSADFDLILLDVRMPRRDGHAVLADIRARDARLTTSTPVIVLTAEMGQDTRLRALASGADDFLTKPLSMDETIHRITNVLARHILFRETKASEAVLEDLVRHRTEQLAERERFTTAIMDTAQEMILTVDTASGLIRSANLQARKLLTGTDAALSGRKLETFLSDGGPALTPGQHELNFRAAGGSVIPHEVSIARMAHQPDVAVLSARDIRERLEHDRQVRHMALHNPLTDLPNRRALFDRLDALYGQAVMPGMTVLYVSFRILATANVNFGPNFQDNVLVVVANVLRERFQHCCEIYSWSDDFILLCATDELPRVLDEFARLMRGTITVGPRELQASGNVGYARFGADGADPQILIRNVALAAYFARKNEIPCLAFQHEQHLAITRRNEIIAHLPDAFSKNQLTTVFQPKVCLQSGRVIGAEALSRWTSPELGRVAADEFIPALEDMGMIGALGMRALTNASAFAQVVRRDHPEFVIAVNASPIEIMSDMYLPNLKRVLFETGLPAENLEIEITETALMTDTQRAMAFINELSDLGASIAMDDFGSGYSSLAQLSSLKAHSMKIDKQFVGNIVNGANDQEIIRVIVGLGKTLNMKIVAEGIERPEEAALIRRFGVDFGQGFHFAKPCEAAAFSATVDAIHHRKVG